MNCLTVCQPWGAGIMHGDKEHENRGWYTKVRGALLIHVGLSDKWMTPQAVALCSERCTREQMAVRGSIIGVANLVDVVSAADALLTATAAQSKFICGPWCFVLRDRRAFPAPIPYRGQQGFFEVPDSVVRGQLDAVGFVPMSRAGA